MRILNIERFEWDFYLKVEDIEYVDYIMFDSIHNLKNVGSNLDLVHTQILTLEDEEFEILDNDYIKVSSTLLDKMDMSAFIVTLRSYTTNYDKPFNPYFYYDRAEVFYKEVELLISQCDTCLDKHRKESIAMFILRKDLLLSAIELNILNDAVKYYIDLARILKIDVSNLDYRSSYLRHGEGPSTTAHMQYVTQERPQSYARRTLL